jgi:hypothetical protein
MVSFGSGKSAIQPYRFVMRPEDTRFVQEVHVDMSGSALQLRCERCARDEVVLLEAKEFDDYVKRFMRVHPTACVTSLPTPRVDGS